MYHDPRARDALRQREQAIEKLERMEIAAGRSRWAIVLPRILGPLLAFGAVIWVLWDMSRHH